MPDEAPDPRSVGQAPRQPAEQDRPGAANKQRQRLNPHRALGVTTSSTCTGHAPSRRPHGFAGVGRPTRWFQRCDLLPENVAPNGAPMARVGRSLGAKIEVGAAKLGTATKRIEHRYD